MLIWKKISFKYYEHKLTVSNFTYGYIFIGLVKGIILSLIKLYRLLLIHCILFSLFVLIKIYYVCSISKKLIVELSQL